MVDRLLGKKVIGIKQASKSLKNGLGRTLYVAKDAEEKLTQPVVELAKGLGTDVQAVMLIRQVNTQVNRTKK